MKSDQTYRRSRLIREDYTFTEKWRIFVKKSGTKAIIGLLLFSLLFPAIAEFSVITSAVIASQVTFKLFPYGVPDGTVVKNKKSTPVYSLGIGIDEKKPLFVTTANMLQHLLVMGTTGAGKTELLLFFTAQAMAQGSGAIFVDGKGDVKTWWRLFSIAKRLGVEENLLILNFGTHTNPNQSKYTLTNSMNPFALGEASELAEMMSSLMAEAGGDNAMWKGRAEGYMRDVLTALVYIRDKYNAKIGPGILADYMPLDAIETLLGLGTKTEDPRFPYRLEEGSQAYIQIVRFLENLPGYQMPKPGMPAPKGREDALKQLGFLTMQFTEILGLFNNTYQHLMGFENAEVDFYDVILNRRTLYVMLPALEKSASTISNLGKVTLNQIRSALSKMLGAAGIEGSRLERLESRPTNSETAALLILDEFGSYAQKGFGEVAAQARSIGISSIFAVQDFASLKLADGGKGDEATRVWGNTNIKLIMKTEDSKETMQLVKERVGKGMVLSEKSRESKKGLFSGWRSKGESMYEEIDRIDPMDLYDFENGKMLVITKSNIWKVQAPFLDNNNGPWKDVDYVYAQRALPLGQPDIVEIQREIDILENVLNITDSAEHEKYTADEEMESGFQKAVGLYREAEEKADEKSKDETGFVMAAYLTKKLHELKSEKIKENATNRISSRKHRDQSFDESVQIMKSPEAITELDTKPILSEEYKKASMAENFGMETAFQATPDLKAEFEKADIIKYYADDLNDSVPQYKKQAYIKIAIDILDGGIKGKKTEEPSNPKTAGISSKKYMRQEIYDNAEES